MTSLVSEDLLQPRVLVDTPRTLVRRTTGNVLCLEIVHCSLKGCKNIYCTIHLDMLVVIFDPV